jgi:hypothetical protein
MVYLIDIVKKTTEDVKSELETKHGSLSGHEQDFVSLISKGLRSYGISINVGSVDGKTPVLSVFGCSIDPVNGTISERFYCKK